MVVGMAIGEKQIEIAIVVEVKKLETQPLKRKVAWPIPFGAETSANVPS